MPWNEGKPQKCGGQAAACLVVVGHEGLPRQEDVRQYEDVVHAMLQHVVYGKGALHRVSREQGELCSDGQSPEPFSMMRQGLEVHPGCSTHRAGQEGPKEDAQEERAGRQSLATQAVRLEQQRPLPHGRHTTASAPRDKAS